MTKILISNFSQNLENFPGDFGFHFLVKISHFFIFLKIEIQKSVKHDFCRVFSAPKMAIFCVLKGVYHKFNFSAKNLLQLLSHFYKLFQGILASTIFLKIFTKMLKIASVKPRSTFSKIYPFLTKNS